MSVVNTRRAFFFQILGYSQAAVRVNLTSLCPYVGHMPLPVLWDKIWALAPQGQTDAIEKENSMKFRWIYRHV